MTSSRHQLLSSKTTNLGLKVTRDDMAIKQQHALNSVLSTVDIQNPSYCLFTIELAHTYAVDSISIF